MSDPSTPPRVTLWENPAKTVVHTGTCHYRRPAHARLQLRTDQGALEFVESLSPNTISAFIARSGRTCCTACKPMARIDQQARADRRRREDERNR